MSLNTILTLPSTDNRSSFPAARAWVALAAVVVVIAGFFALSRLFVWGVAPQPRNPFGLPLREASPFAGGLGGMIIVLQAQFYAAMTGAVMALKAQNGAVGALAGIGFVYGVFHAAGPGHGKGVISAYVLARGRSIARGLTLSLAAALLQATVAIILVSLFAIALNTPTASINTAARAVEFASFAAIAAFGGVLLWRKAGEFLKVLWRQDERASDEAAEGNVEASRGTPSGTPRDEIREFIAVTAAAGIRPCSGAILLLVFSLSQGVFAAGILGALAMALGTSITTGTLSIIATSTRRLAQRAASRGNSKSRVFVAGFELIAAAFVLTLGVIMLATPFTGISPAALD